MVKTRAQTLKSCYPNARFKVVETLAHCPLASMLMSLMMQRHRTESATLFIRNVLGSSRARNRGY